LRGYGDYEGFAELALFICQGDARFFNLETTLNYEGDVLDFSYVGLEQTLRVLEKSGLVHSVMISVRSL